MKLVYKITMTFMIPLVVTLGLWGWLSYRTMERNIHADTDLILRDYSDNIIARKLSGAELPERFNGAYNTYYIKEVVREYAAAHPAVEYKDTEAYIKSQEDFASSRMRTQIFMDRDGRYYEIGVSLPTFEDETLVEHVLWWTGILFFVLLIALIIIGILVIDYNMRPFNELMRWMDRYVPGHPHEPIPSDTDVVEFRKLGASVREAVDRFEHEYEERRIFIGNASHELQTPLAVCSNRIEMMLDKPDLSEEVADELVRIHRSIQHLVRLNKTLLLLSKIENDQFPDVSDVDFTSMLRDAVELNDEIYGHKSLRSSFVEDGNFMLKMNEQMASVLVGNLLKNAYVHTPQDGGVKVSVWDGGFSVSNSGVSPLDPSRMFSRFYLPGGRKEGSTGLGLALAYSVCDRNGLTLSYEFADGCHVFSVKIR